MTASRAARASPASCVEAGTSFDLHELDAASNNKVDDIRDLIAKVALGTPGRTKVYILDEVHMLTPRRVRERTAQDPRGAASGHVVFVLATTDPQKVLPTIRSRAQRFEFNLLPADVLADHVRWVTNDAGLEIDDESIDYVVRKGGGSARDTLTALDRVVAGSGETVDTDPGLAIVEAICDQSPGGALVGVADGLTVGREPRTLGEEVLDRLRNAFLLSMGAELRHVSGRDHELATEHAERLPAARITRGVGAARRGSRRDAPSARPAGAPRSRALAHHPPRSRPRPCSTARAHRAPRAFPGCLRSALRPSPTRRPGPASHRPPAHRSTPPWRRSRFRGPGTRPVLVPGVHKQLVGCSPRRGSATPPQVQAVSGHRRVHPAEVAGRRSERCVAKPRVRLPWPRPTTSRHGPEAPSSPPRRDPPSSTSRRWTMFPVGATHDDPAVVQSPEEVTGPADTRRDHPGVG